MKRIRTPRAPNHVGGFLGYALQAAALVPINEA